MLLKSLMKTMYAFTSKIAALKERSLSINPASNGGAFLVRACLLTIMEKELRGRFLTKGTVAALLFTLFFFAPFEVAATSLWKKAHNNKRSMFADKVAHRKGDIVTILVSETNSMTQSVRTTTDKDATIENVVTSFLYPAAASDFGSHNGTLPNTNIEGQNDYTGGGSITNSQTLSGKISVMIIDELPNGNLVIEGVRLVTFSNERQYAVLHGIIRPYDIASDNMIGSDKIADARVEYISEGSLTDAQKKGWLMKINDLINPF